MTPRSLKKNRLSLCPQHLAASKTLRSRRSTLLLSFGFAVVGLVSFDARAQTSGTWNSPTDTAKTPTLTSTTTGGVYTSSTTLAVGDAVFISGATAGGLTNNRVYYVVAASGGNYTLSAAPGGTAITGTTTAGTAVTSNGVYTWDATAATNTQNAASWSGGGVPNGADAVATFSNGADLASDAIAIKNAVTIGSIVDSQSNNDLNLLSSNSGATTTLSALTFATTSATPAGPSITNSGTKLIRLGLQDNSVTQGKLKINGTQGLTLIANGTTGSFRIENVDWSGFTDGGTGMGTLTIQQGQMQTTTGSNILGTGTGALNVTVGNAAGGSNLAGFSLGNAGQTVNILNGTASGRIYGAYTLTVGDGNGTGGDFAGIIGQDLSGSNSNTNLTKTGTGTQTISGTMVGTSGNVSVSGGTLILSNGGNSYGGTTTISSTGILRLTASKGAGNTTGISISGASSTLDLRNDSNTTFGNGTTAYAVTTGASGATINVDRATTSGTGATMTIGTLGLNSATTNVINFTGADNTSLSVGAVTGGAATTTDTITNAIAGGGSLTLASYTSGNASAGETLLFNGAGNTTVTGAISQNGSNVLSLTSGGSGTLTLSNSTNAYTGITTVSGGGKLSVGTLANGGAASSIGSSSNAAANLVLNNGTLSYTGGSVTTDRGFTYAVGSGGTIEITNAATALEFDGVNAASAVGGGALIKTGAGTLVLGGSSSSTNFGLIVNAGEVDLAKTGTAYALDRNGFTINNGGIVKLTGTSTGQQQIQDNQALTINNGTFNMNGKTETAGTLTVGDGTNNGVVSGGSTSTYTVLGGQNYTLEMKSGSVDVKLVGAALNKTTTGTVVLSQSNTGVTGATTIGTSAAGNTNITSATANGGTLQLTANGALGSGTSGTSGITVNNGGTLLLSGAATAGTTAPGGVSDRVVNNAPISLGTSGGTGVGGTITISGTGPVLEGTARSTANGGSSTTASPYATTATTSVVGLGALTLTSNSTLNYGSTVGTMVFSSFADAGNAFKLNIINYTNTTTTGATVSGVDGTDDRLVFNTDVSAFITAGDFTFNGSSSGVYEIPLDSGFYEVSFTAVPEPTTVLGGALLAGAVGWRKRRAVRTLLAMFGHSKVA